MEDQDRPPKPPTRQPASSVLRLLDENGRQVTVDEAVERVRDMHTHLTLHLSRPGTQLLRLQRLLNAAARKANVIVEQIGSSQIRLRGTGSAAPPPTSPAITSADQVRAAMNEPPTW